MKWRREWEMRSRELVGVSESHDGKRVGGAGVTAGVRHIVSLVVFIRPCDLAGREDRAASESLWGILPTSRMVETGGAIGSL